MTYRLAGALALPGLDRDFLGGLASTLHSALPGAGFLAVLGLGGGRAAGPDDAGIRSFLVGCGLAALLLPPPSATEAAAGIAPGAAASAGPCPVAGTGRLSGFGLASLAPDGGIAYRVIGQADDPDALARALAEAMEPWPVLPGPLPGNTASDPALPIVLVGPMASGKTTLGSLLARREGATFLDLDCLVEGRAGLTVSRIFETEGEAGFRRRESEALEEALCGAGCGRPATVIATGGGAVLAERNRALLSGRSRVVWLHADAALLAARAAADEAPGVRDGPTGGGPMARVRRPLLSGVDPVARLSALQKERLPFYASVASYLLPVEGRESGDLVEVLHDALL